MTSRTLGRTLAVLLLVAGGNTRGALANELPSATLTQDSPGISAPAEQSAPQPGQLRAKVPPGSPGPVGQTEEKRIMGVLPNYRTAEMSAASTPLSAKQKLRIAVKDSFDYPLAFVAAAYAGIYQANDSHPEFGQGAKGYFSRLGTSFTDQVDGNMWAEGLLPALLREDPRYFRMSEGSVKSRAWYAISRIVVTRTDSGHRTFNSAEVFGNGIAAAVGLSYYPDDRDVASFVQNWGTQLATDAGSQILKEFWPDIRRRWVARHSREKSSGL